MNGCELTILMPCLNESETLAACIKRAQVFLIQNNVQGEILIADNQSSDGSQAIAKNAGARVIEVPEKGYGAALLAGIHAANGRYVIMGDADDSYHFSLVMPFLTKLRRGYDLVMGNRFQGGIKKGAMPFLNRYLGNPILSLLGKLFFHAPINDFHCGLRGFDRQKIINLDLKGKGMEFASEMVVKASMHGYKMTEVPTPLFKDGRSRKPHLRPWRDGWRHLRLLLLLSPTWLFLVPGACLLSAGIVGLLVLAQGEVTLGHLVLDIHTMLFASLAAITGLQGISFAIFAERIAQSQLKLPPSSMATFLDFFTFDRGVVIGLLLVLCGSLGAIYTFWYWQQGSFGPLMPRHSMRILIPSITAFILGLQCQFVSFFSSILRMHIK